MIYIFRRKPAFQKGGRVIWLGLHLYGVYTDLEAQTAAFCGLLCFDLHSVNGVLGLVWLV